MAFKLGMTGMDQASETALRDAFERVRDRLGGHWSLVSEPDADHVIVDMDSMYGPMSWISLHAAGKQVIGLTTGERTQADYRLGRPFSADSLATLLTDISGDAPAKAALSDADTAASEAPPATSTPAPAPADELPEELAADVDEEAAAPPGPANTLEPETAGDPAPAETENAPGPEPEPGPKRPRDRSLADWLAPGALHGRWRYRHGDAELVFDTGAGTYHGPATLKPLASAFDGVVKEAALESLDDAAWEAASGSAGPAQPLARLRWFGGLVAGNGALLPGNDPGGQYRLVKWPQTEREYPRHFRIATAMMKGPATLAEVAAASNVPESEVADFVNANLATGYAEFVPPAPPEPDEPPKPTGLFGRLRGR